jgi:hypothetical protein
LLKFSRWKFWKPTKLKKISLLLSWTLDVTVGCFHGNVQKLWTLSSLHPSALQMAHDHKCLVMYGVPQGDIPMVRRCIVLDYREHCGLRRSCEFFSTNCVLFWTKHFGEIWEKYVFASVKLTSFAIFGQKIHHFLYHKIEKKKP